jgi:hypothetical protein
MEPRDTRFLECGMIYKGKMNISEKLAKQLKALERKPERVSFCQTLDAVADLVNAPKKRARRV